VATGQPITVKKASISLGYLACARTKRIQGDSSIFLDDYKVNAPFPVAAATVQQGTRSSFPVPGKLKACKPSKTGGGGNGGGGGGHGGGGGGKCSSGSTKDTEDCEHVPTLQATSR
jgi:hypothetical protein